MAKLFFDTNDISSLGKIESLINKSATSLEEKTELFNNVDGILIPKALETVCNILPEQYHEEFLERFIKRPYDESIYGFLDKKVGKDVQKELKKELENLSSDILQEITFKDEVSSETKVPIR